MAQDGKLVFPFDGGVFGGAVDDIVQPPDFVESKNVRLSLLRGAPAKAPRITDISTISSIGFRCSGVIPHAASGTAYYGMDTPIRATEVSTARVQRHDGAALGYGVTRPLKIAAAGATMPGRSTMPPSVAISPDGGRWVAQIKQRAVRSFGSSTVDGTVALYVSYTDSSGRVVIASRYVCDVESGVTGMVTSPHWCSITTHATTGGFAIATVWYRPFSLTAGALPIVPRPLYSRYLAVNESTFTVGPEVTVASPSIDCRAPAVFSLGDSDAWYAVPMTDTTLQIGRVAPDGFTRATTTITTSASLANASCSLWVHPDRTYAVVALVGPGRRYCAAMDPSALSVTSAYQTSGASGHAMCAALGMSSSDGTGDWYGVAYSVASVAMPNTSTTAAYPATRIEALPVGTSATSLPVGSIGYDIPHMRLAAAYAATDTTFVAADVSGTSNLIARGALLALTPWYGPYSTEDDRSYPVDPALFVASAWVDLAGALRVGWHARVGVDRMQSRVCSIVDTTGFVQTGFTFAGTSFQVVNGQAAVGYLERSESTNRFSEAGLTGRFVVFDLGSHQPPVAAVGSALTLSGGSLPLYWDGVELSEQMPLVVPVLTQTAVTGGSLSGAAFIAVVYWRDAQGALHRSAPSLPLALETATGQPVELFVTVPPTLHDATICAEAVCRLYRANSGSSVFKLLDAATDANRVNGCWKFVTVTLAIPMGASAPALYSDGGVGAELPAEPMPPSQDVCVALDRVFAIDAESRSDVWYSKPLQPGNAPEFNGALRVTFPAQAGALIALAEIAGQLIAIGDSGVATLYGDGPDSSGNGGFGPPRIISRQGGTAREAVGRYPGGVIYLGSDGRWQRLDSQGVQPMLKAPRPTAPVDGWALIGNGSEIAFWTGGGAHVYNFELDRWHTWEWAPVFAAGFPVAVTALASENDGSSTAWLAKQYVVPGGAGGTSYTIARLDGSLASTTDQAYWRTGWIVPTGDQHVDVEWSQVVIHAIHEGTHGLTLTVESDYGNGGQSTTHTWTSAELAALRDAISGRYTVGVEVVNRKARSIRLTVQETGAAGTAFRPVSCTVYYSLANGQARRPLKPGARR